MLLVKTYLDKSSIQGIGLFAGEDISVGRTIWKSDSRFTKFYYESELEEFPQVCKDYIIKYAWKKDYTYYLCVDNGKFMNHSDNPNTIDSPEGTFAKEDIKMGEEITCNYNSFCEIGTMF